MLLTHRSTLTFITLIFVALMALGVAAFPQASIHAEPGGKGKNKGTVVAEPTEEGGTVVKEPTEEEQVTQSGNQTGVTQVRGKQFHSVARKDCSFQVIKTELEFGYLMDLSDLKWGRPTSRDEVVKSEVVVSLERLLKHKKSMVGKAELSMVAKALNLSVSVILADCPSNTGERFLRV